MLRVVGPKPPKPNKTIVKIVFNPDIFAEFSLGTLGEHFLVSQNSLGRTLEKIWAEPPPPPIFPMVAFGLGGLGPGGLEAASHWILGILVPKAP